MYMCVDKAWVCPYSAQHNRVPIPEGGPGVTVVQVPDMDPVHLSFLFLAEMIEKTISCSLFSVLFGFLYLPRHRGSRAPSSHVLSHVTDLHPGWFAALCPWGENCVVLCFSGPCRESCIHGWRLLSLLTGFFLPSNTLMPYATKFLQQASADPASTHQGTGCFPAPKGRGSRRIVIVLPGALEYTTKIRTFTVAAEVVREICEQMGISEQEEIQEFALFASKNGKVVRPVRQDQYIHDYLLEDSSVILDLRRLSWKTPLHFENEIYISIHYSQVTYLHPSLPCSNCSCRHVLMFSACLVSQELMDYTPKPVLQLVNPQALQSQVNRLVLQILDIGISTVSLPTEHVSQLPLFGYNVYPMERCSEPRIPLPCILGVNRDQIIVVASRSQELCCRIPLKEVQRMRTLRPLDDSGVPGLEVNYGSVENPQTMWFELQQVKRALSTACYWPCH
uniref:MyTH4 domain-containing protein n=1 Tax=Terrapene triunguis TaxID=2587831 RepID=A0A674JJK9_9SAUR